MKTVCAWCRVVMKDGTEPVSHGICAACEAKYFPASFWPGVGHNGTVTRRVETRPESDIRNTQTRAA